MYWRLAVVLFAVLLGPSAFQAYARSTPERELLVDAGSAELWSDSRQSDSPLRGRDIVRRDSSDLRELTQDFKQTWIVIVDGAKHESGACGFSIEFSEPADTATPKVFLMTAVDPKTCQVEFTVGVPEDPKIPAVPDMEYDLGDPEPVDEADRTASFLTAGTLGYMSPESASRLVDDPSYYPLPQIRYTVIAEWMDPPRKTVNRVLSAVKARVAKNDKQSHARCKNQRAWLVSDQINSHWQNKSTGKWGKEECNKSNYRTEAVTSARFKNEDFPPCAALNDPAWVYYDSVLARASTTTSRGSFQYGIVSTWQEGCGEILGWAGFRTYPGEYNNIDPV